MQLRFRVFLDCPSCIALGVFLIAYRVLREVLTLRRVSCAKKTLMAIHAKGTACFLFVKSYSLLHRRCLWLSHVLMQRTLRDEAKSRVCSNDVSSFVLVPVPPD